MNKTAKPVHYWYWIGILTLLCVGLFSKAYGSDTELVQFVSFAATLSSLILAVVAILYNFVTHNQSLKNAESLNRSVDRVDDSAGRVREASKELCELVKELPQHLDALSSEQRKTRESFDEVKATLTRSTTETVQSMPAEQTVAEEFVRDAPFLGQIALYTCLLSKEKQITFRPEEIYRKEENVGYMWGFLMGAKAANQVRFSFDEESMIVLEYVHPYIEQYIRDIVYAKAGISHQLDLDMEETDAEWNWRYDVWQVEKYFAGKREK